jgi:hypothetical protein
VTALVARSASGFNLEIELKNIILRRFSIFEFLHSQVTTGSASAGAARPFYPGQQTSVRRPLRSVSPNAAVRHVDSVKSLLSTLGATLIEPKAPSLGQRGDRVDDHIVSHKNDYAALYRCYGVLPWRSRLKINFCEIFSSRSIFRLLQHYPPEAAPAGSARPRRIESGKQ